MITPELLKLRIALLLKHEKPIRGETGKSRWDYEPEYRLTWTDAHRVTHFCRVPPAPIPDSYVPATICGTPVDSLDIRLVDSHELGGTNCPGCFRGDMAGLPRFRGAPHRRRQAAYLACGFLMGGLFVALADDVVVPSGPAETVAEAPIVRPVIHDQDQPANDIGAEF